VKVKYSQKGADVSQSVISKDTAVEVKTTLLILREFTQALPHP
jgi:hypothetical protein